MIRCRLALSLAALLLPVPGALAAPLDKAACDQLKLEQGQLEQSGVRANMAKGPEWAKGNLKPEQLEQIRRVIEVDGQLLFRCNGRPLVALPNLEEPREDGGEPAKAKEEEQGHGAAPEQQTPPGKAATITEKAAMVPKAKAPAVAASAIKLKAKPKAAPKAKPNDAYKPPASDPQNPFANQLPPGKE
jgi:hypothetical protein